MAYLREEVKAGMIVSAFLLILSVFAILIGGAGLFKQQDIYYINVNNTSGLIVGGPVKIGGVKVGSVLDIQPPEFPGDRIFITFGLKKGMGLFKGTKAVITQGGVIGEVHILLSIDEISREKISPGEVLPVVEKEDVTILLSKVSNIAESVNKLLDNVNTLLNKKMIKDAQEAVNKTRSVLNEINGLVVDTRGDIAGLLSDARKAVTQAEEMMQDIENIAEKSAGTIETTAASVVKTTESIGGAVESQSENVGNLLITLTETTEDLQEFLQQIKNKPWSVIYRETEEKDD